MHLARIILPLPVDRPYTYAVPEHFRHLVRVGRRVVVPFGKRKLAGVVVAEGAELDLKGYEAKDIIDVDIELTPMPQEVLKLTQWIAKYYMCSWGEAARAALPPGSAAPTARSRARTVTMVNLSPEAPSTPPTGNRQQAIMEQLKIWDAAEKLPMPQMHVLAECGGTAATLQRLEALGYIEFEVEVVDRSEGIMPAASLKDESIELHKEQTMAIEAITKQLDEGNYGCFLLHGVTGSGKTEVYLRALKHARDSGKTGIVLVPEISLTPQTVRRFRRRFGDDVAVLHSRMSLGERYDAWRGIADGRYPIVIGPRSAVLAPLKNPGLIIVDEEHEASYKQYDPAPRYHARDVAVVRAMNNGATCILGSATPSLESLTNAREGKYQLLEMPERVPIQGSPATLPKVHIVDLRNEKELNARKENLSKRLVEAIEERIEKGEQAILLLNRRGFSPVMECSSCGWVPECPDCSVSMVYHKPLHHLRCHYCGQTARVPATCGECKLPALEFAGTGTQRLEEELQSKIPHIRQLRMDLDTTAGKGSHNSILDQFGKGHADVLLGTQMVAKGLDFDRVTLVGIIHAEAGLMLPDIRAEERAFQLLTQVSGRSGRADRAGEVILQSRQPGHPIIQFAIRHDFAGFAEYALETRVALGYPPAGRLVSITFSGPNDDKTRDLAEKWRACIDSCLPVVDRLGPSPAFVHKLKNRFRHQILLKIPLHVPASHVRTAIEAAGKAIGSLPHAYRLTVDIDPVGIV